MKIPTMAAATATVDQIGQVLESDGVVFLTDYLNASEVEQLAEDYEAILSAQESGIDIVNLDRGRAAVLHRAENDRFPHVQRVFGSAMMNDISQNFFQAPFGLNRDVYVLHEVVGTVHIAQELHFDVLPTLKFFIYLNDVSRVNGAFSCVPGSHKFTKRIRAEYGEAISFEERGITRDHDFSENQILPVEGPAGSMIVFTTEVWHRAGTVSVGDRKLMRGHTRVAETKATPQLMKAGRFSKLKKMVGF